jgi:hypothetical protein
MPNEIFCASSLDALLTLYSDAFNRYAPIASLTNIPASIFGTTVYEVLLKDSFALIASGHNVHEDGEEGLSRHLTRVGTLNQRASNFLRGESNERSDRNESNKFSPV